MFVPRKLTQAILEAFETFPAVIVTGPRQSGKTTLLKKCFGDSFNYVSLEDIDIRTRALQDPVGFLEANPEPLIIDEIQYAPNLLSYIKTKIDENRKPGQWLITGSQNFTLMAKVSQSLAGRACIFNLLGFSFEELGIKKHKADFAKCLLRGSYPEPALNLKVNRKFWYSSYIQTYLEKDIRQIVNIADLTSFERFLHLLAFRNAQILNMSALATDVGVSVPTIKRWISILETSSQIFVLPPYFRNFGKRLTKSPKLYFLDTGLLTYLLGIHSPDGLQNNVLFGYLFESAVVAELVKQFFYQGEKPAIYFFRENNGLEVDLILELVHQPFPIEIKATRTIDFKSYENVAKFMKLTSQVRKGFVIANIAAETSLSKNIVAFPWHVFSISHLF
jgi:hypothetical protein